MRRIAALFAARGLQEGSEIKSGLMNREEHKPGDLNIKAEG
jgi:hypothetical protein